jgi:spermidine synthase
MMLAVFLLGIFLGSLLIVPLARRIENQRTVLICLQAGIGLYVLFSLYNMNSLLSPPWNSYNLSDPVTTFMRYFIDSSSLMLVPTILFGMSFPVLIKIVSGGTANVGRGTGQIYSANSLGAIIGSLVAGFIILPLLGSQDSLALISSINLMMAAWLFLTGSYLSYGVRRGIAVVSLSTLLFINLAMPGDLLDRFFMRDSAGERGTDKLLFFEEGLTDTVAVFQDNYGLLDPDAKRLITNGISMSASNVIASRYMKLFAHVPILLLDNPEDVMVVCFGTGQTTGAASIHPRVKSVDSLELSASVLRAGTTFAKENHDVLNNPKVNYILQDGRNHLLTTKKLYDVITSEPPPPRTAFTVNLYTREYYEMSKARLKPGGIVAQWIPLHSQGEKEVAMHFKTFMEVFPHAMGWISVADEILIIGSDQPIKIDFNKLQQRLQEPVIKKALADIEIHNIYSFLSNIWYLEEDMLKLGSVVPAITDNRPSIEFYLDLGKTIGLSGKEKIVFNRTSFNKIADRITGLEYEDKKKLREYYNVMDLYQRGVMYGNRGQLLEAMSRVEDNNLFQYHLQAGQDQIAILVQQVEKDPDDIGSLLTLGHMYYQIGSHQKSIDILNQVLQKSPDQSYANLYIAHNLLETGDSQGARKHYEATAKRDPRQMQVAMEGAALADLLAKFESDRENLGLATSVAQFYNMKKEYLKALEYTIPALAKDPMDTRLLQSIIFSYRGLGEANEVLIYGSRYEMVEPDNIDLQYIMGEVYAKTMRCKKAVRYFQVVLKKNDNFRDAQNMLDDCQASLDPSDILS